ncbi:hypothetical protein H5410_024791 [Solanum commersonii]|uniref:Uncharacterized protein n=1 Tax=Solanum commersonii TaxID=4109 RepID=A0A9J5ZMZ3_SOLCO|nr:hypothetical protein H5410_024791 [Solanum commersonii]
MQSGQDKIFYFIVTKNQLEKSPILKMLKKRDLKSSHMIYIWWLIRGRPSMIYFKMDSNLTRKTSRTHLKRLLNGRQSS